MDIQQLQALFGHLHLHSSSAKITCVFMPKMFWTWNKWNTFCVQKSFSRVSTLSMYWNKNKHISMSTSNILPHNCTLGILKIAKDWKKVHNRPQIGTFPYTRLQVRNHYSKSYIIHKAITSMWYIPWITQYFWICLGLLWHRMCNIFI